MPAVRRLPLTTPPEPARLQRPHPCAATSADTPAGPSRTGPAGALWSGWAGGLTIRLRLLLLGAAVVVGLLLLISGQTWQAYQSARESRQAELKHSVEVALSVVRWAHGLEQAGQLGRPQAQALALSALKTMRYGDGEYFWVNDMAPRVVMHPIKPALDGRLVGDMKDPEGTPLFLRFVQTVQQQQAGWVRYLWPKPGHELPVEKVSYVAGFQPWGWVVGTGLYMDDLRAAFLAQARQQALLAAGVLALVLLLLHRVYRAIARGLDQALAVTEAIAAGDVRQEIRPEGRDELAQLMHGMRRMSAHLNRTMGGVQQAAQALAQASEEIDQANQDLSQRTERAAASLQAAAGSLGEITRSVQGSAGSAGQARERADVASSVADEGGHAVAEAVRTMAGIHQASQRIGDILGVIDGIAFQTNILALNAAVEAARAGEQGRGFAVVASEVRVLAQRSAQAAREIKQLIQDSVQRTGQGTRLVESAGDTMQRVLVSVSEVNGLIAQISSAGQAQGQGLAAVHARMGELDEATRHNAALVEQSAAAAGALRQQAEQLSQAVQQFKLRPDLAGEVA